MLFIQGQGYFLLKTFREVVGQWLRSNTMLQILCIPGKNLNTTVQILRSAVDLQLSLIDMGGLQIFSTLQDLVSQCNEAQHFFYY